MTVERALARGLRGGIRAYQWVVSPLLPPSCRFEPSCSNYGHEAIGRHGPLRGTWLTILRVARCHPFSQGGYDAVPPGDRYGS